LLYAACRGLHRRCLEKAGERGRDTRWDDPAGGNLADQFRQDIADSRCDDAASDTEPARDPVKRGAAERSLHLRTRERRSVGPAKPGGDFGAEAG